MYTAGLYLVSLLCFDVYTAMFMLCCVVLFLVLCCASCLCCVVLCILLCCVVLRCVFFLSRSFLEPQKFIVILDTAFMCGAIVFSCDCLDMCSCVTLLLCCV